jgi:hypothetical protein
VIKDKPASFFVLAILIGALSATQPSKTFAQTQAENVSTTSSAAQWSLQVEKVDVGDVDLASSFQFAIYENLLKELSKQREFKLVLRDGATNAATVSDLLILKTTVQKYSAGSETKRAVTTVAGATKLTVRTQLCTRDGKVVLERTVNGNVRFMGSNLRATHNLARNVTKAIRQASLPGPSLSPPGQAGQL